MKRRKHEPVEEKQSLILNMNNNNNQPTASHLLSLDPVKAGWLEKKNESCLSWMCPYCIKPWKRRYFILIGNFLFRYSSTESDNPKGVPIPVDSVTVSLCLDDLCFEISTLRKSYILRATSADECKSWMNEIRKRKQLSIKEGLGHLPTNSNIEFVNRIGMKLFDDRLRRDQDPVRNPLTEFNPMSGTQT
eukprot:gene9848-20485_t